MSARKLGIGVAAAIAALLVLLCVGWTIDALVGGKQVRRGVHLAGRDIGGMDVERLDRDMHEIDARVAATPVEVRAGGKTAATTLGQLGVSVDLEATADAAFAARGGGFVLFRPFSWFSSLLTDHDAPVRLHLDRDAATATVATLDATIRTDPVEPSLTFTDGALTTVAGVAGSQLDPASVIDRLAALDGDGIDGSTVVIDAAMIPLPPTLSDASAAALLTSVQAQLSRPIEVVFGDESRTLDTTELQPFVSAQLTDGGGLALSLAESPTLGYLSTTFADVGEAAVEPELSVSGGTVVIGDGKPGTKCCAPEAVATLSHALEAGASEVELTLATRPPEHDAEYYRNLGIKESIASFTTEHPCCAPRVDNIHRMADIVGAHVIAPGETFSLNETVGRRTIENGFQAAPVIDGDGNFQDDVGGGVSQFSTTLFNAAFFGGLEIDEYMAHGLYISRYPYGREATLSFPSPDLKIRNTTPYGILIWPTYTSTSITVTLYSTPYIEAEQSGQSEAVYGQVCTQVTTLRTRTWIDTGKSEVDRFYALYAPGEGVQCDGTTRPKAGESTTTTTTTAPGPTTTEAPPTPTSSTSAPDGSTTTTTAASSTTSTANP